MLNLKFYTTKVSSKNVSKIKILLDIIRISIDSI